MPAPRQMQYGGPQLDADAQRESALQLVDKLSSDDAAEVAMAAAELYKMTSFNSAVAIDRPEALTDYDRAVFGNGAGGGQEVSASGAPSHQGAGAENPSFAPGEAHLDGHRYLMGDGFMLNEDEGPNGSVRTRRVAVMHSRNCLDNRAIIGKLPGVFEALVKAIGCVPVRIACGHYLAPRARQVLRNCPWNCAGRDVPRADTKRAELLPRWCFAIAKTRKPWVRNKCLILT